MDTGTVPVTRSALYQRVNRQLAKNDCRLKKARGRYAKAQFGDWYVLDWRHNTVPRRQVDLVALATELGVLHPWEAVREQEGA
jgi:hypothetical protein